MIFEYANTRVPKARGTFGHAGISCPTVRKVAGEVHGSWV